MVKITLPRTATRSSWRPGGRHLPTEAELEREREAAKGGLFEDRIELSSPGALANTMTIESLAFRQAARNEAISSLLAKCAIPSEGDWLRTSRRTLMDKRGGRFLGHSGAW
jgi:hypothetical protein